MGLCLLVVAGCGPAKLDVTRNISLDSQESRSVDLDPQPKPQTLTVTYEAGAELFVGVYKAADAPDLQNLPEGKALKSESGKKSGTLTVEVPENTATRIVIANAKTNTDVKLHITNQK